jgi:hypothetical protein
MLLRRAKSRCLSFIRRWPHRFKAAYCILSTYNRLILARQNEGPGNRRAHQQHRDLTERVAATDAPGRKSSE